MANLKIYTYNIIQNKVFKIKIKGFKFEKVFEYDKEFYTNFIFVHLSFG